MKQITLNIPNDYADVLTVTVIGGARTSHLNVYNASYDITQVEDREIIDVKAGGKNDD